MVLPLWLTVCLVVSAVVLVVGVAAYLMNRLNES
jgi:hypothetical protein